MYKIVLLFIFFFVIGCKYNCPKDVKTVMSISDKVRIETYYNKNIFSIKDNQGNCLGFSQLIIERSIEAGINYKDIKFIDVSRMNELHRVVLVKGDEEWWIVPTTGVIGQYPVELEYYKKYMCNNFNNCWWVIEKKRG